MHGPAERLPRPSLDDSRTRRSHCWVLPSPFVFRFGAAVPRSPSRRVEGFRRGRARDLRTLNREPRTRTLNTNREATLPAKIAETLSLSEITVQGGEVQGP